MSASKKFTQEIHPIASAAAAVVDERQARPLTRGEGHGFVPGMQAANDHPHAVPSSGTKPRGYFQFIVERLVEIARLGLGPDAMAAYLVLAGGVNGRDPDKPRVTGHSANSVATRTMMSRRAAEKAIDTLERHGFIERADMAVSGDQAPRACGPSWKVDPSFSPDLALDQGFLAVPDASKASIDDRPRRGSLAYLWHWVRGGDGISRRDALVDTLLVFLALHQNQDFAGCGGVDPTLVGGCCDPIQPDGDGPGTAHVVNVDGGIAGLVLVTESSPDCIEFDEAFAVEVLGVVPAWEDAPSFADRFRHALAQLEMAGLCYRSHVVWDADPIHTPPGRHPEVLYTLHAGRTWVPQLETHVADCIHTHFCLNTPESRQARFAESRGESPDWVRSGVFRYVLPRTLARHAKLVMQLRVRWWPARKQTLNELELDRTRNQRWRDQFIEIGLRSSMGR